MLFFLGWLAAQGGAWYSPSLPDYHHYLLHNRIRPNPKTGQLEPALLSPATVKAHLATIRGRYQTLLHDNRIRDLLYTALPQHITDSANRKAMVDELLIRLENDIHPRHTPVQEITVQDTPDAAYLRLTPNQVRALVRAPGMGTLPGARDTAMIALMVCTGIREAELVALNVDDLRQMLGGELALRVQRGKGGKQRLVPYGPLDWCLVYVERWLNAAEILQGAVFRGIYKGGKHVRKTRITERAVNLIMNQYVISIEGRLTPVQPHDLRRTYARNAYENGMDVERIRQNLGHESVSTTQGYIGTLDGVQRRPPEMFRLPHSAKELNQSPAKDS